MGDSITYLKSWIDNSVMAIRPSFYPFFLGISMSLGSIYLVILFQILLTSITLEILLIRCLKLSFLSSNVIAVILSVTTTIAWWTNMLMSDIFFGIGGICFFMLAFCNEELNIFERYGLILILFLSLLMHIAIPVLLFAVAMVYLVAAFIRRERLNRMLIALAVLSLFSWSCFSLINRIYGNSLTPSTGLYKFIAGRMAGEGLIGPVEIEHFARNAPERIEKLKEQLDTIQRTVTPNYQRIQVFDYYPVSPFFDWEQDRRLMDFKEIVKQTLMQKPLQNMTKVLEGSMQLWTYPEIPAYIVAEMGPQLGLFLEKPFPGYFQRFLQSRQATGALQLSFWNSIISSCYYFSLIILLLGTVVAVCLRFRERKRQYQQADSLLRFARFLLVFLILHSIIIYFLAGDFPRYQSRMSWLVVLAALCVGITLSTRYWQRSLPPCGGRLGWGG